MKKVLLIVLAVCMVFAAVACAPKVVAPPEASVAQETEKSEPSAQESEETKSSEDTSNSKLATLAKEAEASIKNSNLSEDMLKLMDISITAENNVLVYRYSYKDIDSSLDTSLIKEAIEDGFGALDSQMESTLKLVQAAADGATIRVEYLTNDGEIIIARDYK